MTLFAYIAICFVFCFYFEMVVNVNHVKYNVADDFSCPVLVVYKLVASKKMYASK